MRRSLASNVLLITTATACGWGSGSDWMKEPLVPDEERRATSGAVTGPPAERAASRTLGGPKGRGPSPEGAAATTGAAAAGGGRVLGTFRNTYYDFPREDDHAGEAVPLMSASCAPIAKVPRGFYEAVCVQGSGSLARGGTVSFAKRDCACAEVCPRTGERICFDALDPRAFPFGRGAAGTPITPLRSVAADTDVLPMGTVIHIPELEGFPADGGEPLDGCFVVEDRGLRVKGAHVDIFTGHPSQTATVNREVPSNRGVTVVVDAPKCAHLERRRPAR